MGKDTLWKNRPFGWFLSSLGGFPVTRGTADREALRRCVAVLEAGEPLVLFPGGRAQVRANCAAVVRRGRLRRRCVPACRSSRSVSAGRSGCYPKAARFVHPHKVHVIVGPPIKAPSLAESGRVPRSTIRKHSDELHATLQQLFDDAQQHVGLLETQRPLDQLQ